MFTEGKDGWYITNFETKTIRKNKLMRQVLFLLIVLLSIETLNAQKKDTIDARKHSVYLDLVKSFKDSFEDTPLIINVQSKFRVDGIYYGTMGRTDFTYELGKDMIIVKVLNEKLSDEQTFFKNLDSENFLLFSDIKSKVKELLDKMKNVVVINIYEPLDYWSRYYFIMHNYHFGIEFSFEPVYIPVKFYSYSLNSDDDVIATEEEVKIYIYDINSYKPFLKDICTQQSD